MKIEKTADAPGAMYVRDGQAYKIGRHGKTYRWDGDDWLLSACKLEQLRFGGWVLRRPTPEPRVINDFAHPVSMMTQR